jgi:hypothetical protein
MDPDIKGVHGNQPPRRRRHDSARTRVGQQFLEQAVGQPASEQCRAVLTPGAAPPMTTTSASIRPVHISGLRWLQGLNLIFMSWPGLAWPMRNWL